MDQVPLIKRPEDNLMGSFWRSAAFLKATTTSLNEDKVVRAYEARR